MLVGAVDTGRGTGFAVYRTDDGMFTSWEQRDDLTLDDLAGCSVIIYEIYTVTSRTSETETLRKIGIVEKFCKQTLIKCVGSPTATKKFAKDDKLKALGWFKRTPDGHANDAARHLLAYLLKNRLLTADHLRVLREMLREPPTDQATGS